MTESLPHPQNEAASSRIEWRRAVLWGIGLALSLRIGLGLLMGIAWTTVEGHISSFWFRNPSLYGELEMPISPMGQFWFGVWPRWDAVQHLNLAMRSYSDMSEGATLFFPLYASLTRVLAQLVGGDFIISGLAVSTISAAAAFSLLLLIGRRLFGPGAGKWASIALAAYPASVLLLAPLTESLFLALTLGAFLAAYTRKWPLAALLAVLASLTRASGLAASVAFALIAWNQFSAPGDRRSSASVLFALIAVIAPLAGGAGFLAWRSAAGYPPLPVVLQEHVGTSFVDPLTGIVLAFQQWFRVHDLPTTLDTLSATAFVALTVAMIVHRRWRRPELVVYMIVNMVVLLARRTEGASSLKSMSRYVLVLFPAFLVIGDWLAWSSPRSRFWYIVISASLLIVLSVLYVFWFFLG